jgi:hypothetical protein
MELPITRETLRNYNRLEARDNNMINSGLTRLLNLVQMHLMKSTEIRFIMRNLNIEHITGVSERLIPEFIEKIRENFIDCVVTVDPLRTYVIIDWS